MDISSAARIVPFLYHIDFLLPFGALISITTFSFISAFVPGVS